jgi:hypothetical protein
MPGIIPPPTIFTFFQPACVYWGRFLSGALLPEPVVTQAAITAIIKTAANIEKRILCFIRI